LGVVSFNFQIRLLSCALGGFIVDQVLKVVEQSPMYDWLELLFCLVTVAWYNIVMVYII